MTVNQKKCRCYLGSMMGNLRLRPISYLILAGLIVLSPLWGSGQKKAVTPSVDPKAMATLKSMSDALAGLDKFSYRVVNMREDLTKSGHRVDYEVASRVTVDRPNKIKVVRQGHLVDQQVYYNGKTLTIYSPAKKIYSTVDVPDTIDGTVKLAREKLGIGYPGADLMYSDTFPLLTKGVTSATLIGKEMIAGIRCDHLLFTLPGVDFQVWIADRGDRLPFKYIVTDTGTPQLLSVVAVFDSWDLLPKVSDADFEFVAPSGGRALPLRTVDGKTVGPKKS